MPQPDLGVACQECAEPATVAIATVGKDGSYYCASHEPRELPAGAHRITAADLPTAAGRLRFRAEDVQQLLATGKPIDWAKDTGTYLGVWGETGVELAAYAYTDDDLCLDDRVSSRDDPASFDRIYDATRDICGGDDFGETDIQVPVKPADAQWLLLDVAADTYTLSWE